MDDYLANSPTGKATSALRRTPTIVVEDPEALARLQGYGVREFGNDIGLFLKGSAEKTWGSLTRPVDMEQFMSQPTPTMQGILNDPEMMAKIEEIGLAPSAGGIKKVNVPKADLLSVITSLQRPGQARELVPIAKLRAKSGLSPEEFDSQVVELAQSGKVALHPHDMPFGLSEAERSSLLSIPDPLNTKHRGRTYFVGIVPKPPKIGGESQ